MARIVYRIAEGAQMALGADGQYQLTFGEGGRIRLSPPALMPLLLVDGWRSKDEIQQLADRRYRLPSGIIDWVFSQMVTAGLLQKSETAWRPLEFLDWPCHRCQGCGACCQGEWIGPLDPAFVAQTLPRLEALRTKYPRLEGQPAFVKLEEGNPALYLNSSSGQCVFLDDDMACILHKEHGAFGKPSLCRTFPTVRFEDAERTRIGVGLMCLKHHDQVLDGDVHGGVCEWRGEHEALDGSFFHYYAPEPAALAIERELIEALSGTDDAVALVLERLTPMSLEVSAETPALRLERRARRLLARLDAVLEHDEVLVSAAGQRGLLPTRLSALRALASQGEGAVSGSPLLASSEPLRRPARAALLGDLLHRFFFLRQYLMFHHMAASLAALMLGVWTAAALADDGSRADYLFGEYLATFTRAIQSPAVRKRLFETSDEVTGLLAAFRQFWSSDHSS